MTKAHKISLQVLSVSMLLLVLSLCGCGKKANPVPWTKLRPEAIKDLDYRVVKDGIILTWTVPTRNHDGSPLPQIEEFRLYRAVEPVDGGCPDCPPKYGEPIVIKFDAKPKAGQKVSYEDRTVEPGHYYIYQVRSLKNFMNLSDFSNKVVVAWHSPPEPPANIEAHADEKGIHLSWRAPELFCDGSAVDQGLKYRIWRKFDDDREFVPLPHTTDKTSYTDRFTRTYNQVSYRVTAILDYLDTEIESEPSPEISLLARDIQIKMQPAKLIAFTTAEGVELVWDVIYRPEIKGYFVMRQDPSGLVVQLNPQPITKNSFTDITTLPRGTYTYWIVSIDNADPPRRTRYSRKVKVKIY